MINRHFLSDGTLADLTKRPQRPMDDKVPMAPTNDPGTARPAAKRTASNLLSRIRSI
jgi:hypothetical protein